MIKHEVSKNEDNKTIERILLSNYNIDKNMLYKALRKRDIKINGKRVSNNTCVSCGDIIEAYILLKNSESTQDKDLFKVIFENENVLIVNKKQGISVSQNPSDKYCLIDIINEGKYSYELCHRLDRNTGGLLIISKQKSLTENIKQEINNRYYKKIYKCLVHGDASNIVGIQRAWHFKDSDKNKVYIYKDKRKYSKEIITEIISSKYNGENNTSEIEINLITGRTHQIRAHLAFLGHFVIGDGKYGTNEVNKKFKYKYQALWAYALLKNNEYNAKEAILPEMNFYSEPKYE